MAHQLDRLNGRYSMAYDVEDGVPWHGLGQRVDADAPIEVWQTQANLDWEIRSAPVLFDAGGDLPHKFEEQKVLFRSDTLMPLSTVSRGYKVVQPGEIFEFYRRLIESGKFKMNTAGALFGGKRIWALAKTNQTITLDGGDTVAGYLLMATSADTSLATTLALTNIRVVCHNTMSMVIRVTKNDDNKDVHSLEGKYHIKINHNQVFNVDDVIKKLHLSEIAGSTWAGFAKEAAALSAKLLTQEQVNDLLVAVMGNKEDTVAKQVADNYAIRKVISLYEGEGKGSQLPSAKGTAWGVLNAVTEFIDHHKRSRTPDARMNNAWFDKGEFIKEQAHQQLLALAA